MVRLQPQFLARCVPRTTVIVILTRCLRSTFRYLLPPNPPSSPLTFLCPLSLQPWDGLTVPSTVDTALTTVCLPSPPPSPLNLFFPSLSLSFWSWCWKNSSTLGRGLLCVLRSNKSPLLVHRYLIRHLLTDSQFYNTVVHDTNTCSLFFDLLSGCFHRNLLHDDAFVDEVRVSIRHAASVVLRRAQQVFHNSLDCFIKLSL